MLERHGCVLGLIAIGFRQQPSLEQNQVAMQDARCDTVVGAHEDLLRMEYQVSTHDLVRSEYCRNRCFMFMRICSAGQFSRRMQSLKLTSAAVTNSTLCNHSRSGSSIAPVNLSDDLLVRFVEYFRQSIKPPDPTGDRSCAKLTIPS